MPNRMVRDGMLESEAVLSLPPEGRWLYVSILLSADDCGLFEATTFRLARRADIKADHVPALLQAMADRDLVRLYTPDLNGSRRFGFVTKFDQRLRIKHVRFPLPPLPLLAGADTDVLNLIKDLGSKMSDMCARMSDTCRPEAEEEEEKKNTTPADAGESTTGVADAAATVREKPSSKAGKANATAPKLPDCPHLAVLALWAEVLPELTQHDAEEWNDARAAHLRARWRAAALRDGWQTREDGLAYFRRLFRWVRRSPFLMGQCDPSRPGRRPFRLTLEWLVIPSHYAKVLEGHYHDDGGR